MHSWISSTMACGSARMALSFGLFDWHTDHAAMIAVPWGAAMHSDVLAFYKDGRPEFPRGPVGWRPAPALSEPASPDRSQ